MSQINTLPQVDVDSSSVKSMAYSPAHQILRVQFRNGRIYDYANVTQADYDKVKLAESIGSTLNRYIIRQPHLFPYAEVSYAHPHRLNECPNKKDAELIEQIADRAVQIQRELTGNGLIPHSREDIVRDLIIAHCNTCKLDLQGLLDADLMNFTHDVFEIRRFLDRTTGKFDACFRPRFAVNQ